MARATRVAANSAGGANISQKSTDTASTRFPWTFSLAALVTGGITALILLPLAMHSLPAAASDQNPARIVVDVGDIDSNDPGLLYTIGATGDPSGVTSSRFQVYVEKVNTAGEIRIDVLGSASSDFRKCFSVVPSDAESSNSIVGLGSQVDHELGSENLSRR